LRLFSYRNRTRFRKIAITLLTIFLIAAALTLCVLAYLDRYIVYDSEGAHLDLHWQETSGASQTVATPSIDAEISYVSADDEVAIGSTRKVTGYYISTEMLQDPEAVQTALDAGSYYAVLIDLRDGFGNYYYPSGISGAQTATTVNAQAVKDLISSLRQSGVYLIARIPAFADQNHCLNNTDLGLPLSSGALWADGNGCYWMDPANPGSISHMEAVCTELQSLGFREVVLDDFYFPDSDSIVYDESEKTKDSALTDAFNVLQSDLSALDLKVSIGLPSDKTFPGMLTEGRIYFELDDGAEIGSLVDSQEATVAIPDVQIVFLTESHDTRFESYGYLTPAVEGQVPEDE